MTLLRVMGDPHGYVDLEEDGYWLCQSGLPLCTGDFGYHIQGRERSYACEVMKAFSQWQVATILGNHDGICHQRSFAYKPGEVEPSCQEEMIEALGDNYLGYRRLDFQGFSLVGGRPFSNGNPGINYPPWGYPEIDVEGSAQKILELISGSPNKNVIILSHNGPRGLGDSRESPFGRDWKNPPADWGDEDLAIVLKNIPSSHHVMAVIAGHMHHELRGSGYRERLGFANEIPVINCAVVPRVVTKGLLVAKPFGGKLIEKHVYQEHRHFVDIEIDENLGKVLTVKDFWARRGSRNNEGISFVLWSSKE